ncbi:MAG: glucans biosynthesis glucosyltransferase MdoH [Nibricoccus sp.]
MTGLHDLTLLPRVQVSRRRHGVITILLLLTCPAVMTMADLHWRTGYDGWKIFHLVLFALLFPLVALGATQAIMGFAIRRKGGDPFQIGNSIPAEGGELLTAPTAIVMPICNEEVGRVIDGLRVIYESLEKSGQIEHYHFFLLSDSSNTNRWIEEEAAWLALIRKLDAHGRIFYRKRRLGINKKAGNLADFCRKWGKLYRYMVVLDADSIMTSTAITRLVDLMERNRRVGIIQGMPLLVNGESVLARLQQFASRLYAPVGAAGLNFWCLSEANYWGHNAIIRLAPFIRHCSLPSLPGDGPFGGRILSHDYVEAALMRRAGWQVWLAPDIDGNYEECPPSIIDLAQRDRRWLQGNLQHARLIFAKGFHIVNRIHFILGILSYLASPLWLALVIASTVIAANIASNGLALRPVASFAQYLHWSYTQQAVWLFIYTMGLLFLPKFLALWDLRKRVSEIEGFGGWGAVLKSVVLETLVFTLLAPVLMLFHTWFIFNTLSGQKVSWGAQRRGGDSAWAESWAAHGLQTFLGLAAAFVVIQINLTLAAWMAPMLLGLIFSIPLSYITGSVRLGKMLRQYGYFQTTEETQPLPEISQLASMRASRDNGTPPAGILQPHYGLLQAVLDPYVNAAHVSLLRSKDDPPAKSRERFQFLRALLIDEGPQALTHHERLSLLLDAESMHTLHHEIWSLPSSQLADWWKLALQHYAYVAPPPVTPFTAAAEPSPTG